MATFFPEVAERIQADIEQRLEEGGYGDIQGGQQLADTSDGSTAGPERRSQTSGCT